MNAKRKMIIAISAFAMVILAAVVAVVAVLAAQSVTVKSSLSITYDAIDIYGSASIDYQYKGESGWTNKLSANDAKFEGGTATDEAQNITGWALNGFSKEVDEVIIRFGFNKLNETVDNFNVACAYSISGSDSALVTVTSGTSEGAITTAAAANMFNGSISSTTMQYYYVKIKLNDVKRDISNLSMSFDWTLTNPAVA